ncbi:MAG: site-specific DNA-methyltransferase, partial [Candidatus Aminicenantales bacterium]
MKNVLYYGDNLDILRRYIADESIDLVYLDPPFKSSQNYNVLFKEKNGSQAASQIRAFEDTWTWSQDDEAIYADLVTKGGKVSDCLQAFRTFLGPCDMLAYLVMMAPRLAELRRVMKPTGSIYLHCDPAASHYLKMLMDGVFGPERFINEIVWRRTNAKGLAFTRFAGNHDTILRYSRDDKWTWNPAYTEHDPEYLRKFYRYIEQSTGRRYRLADLTNPNKNRPNLTYEFLGITRVWRWTKERMMEAYQKGFIVQSAAGRVPALKRYLDEQEGTPVDDIWTDILPVQAQAQERLGYPTQKPEALLERIIKASSNEGDLVLDPFCGCGTTIAAAQKFKRRWIGIDITHLAITLIKKRLLDAFGTEAQFNVIGEPTSLPDAAALAEADRYQFQYWALGLVGA